MSFSDDLEEYLNARDAIQWRIVRGYPRDEGYQAELDRCARVLDEYHKEKTET